MTLIWFVTKRIMNMSSVRRWELFSPLEPSFQATLLAGILRIGILPIGGMIKGVLKPNVLVSERSIPIPKIAYCFSV